MQFENKPSLWKAIDRWENEGGAPCGVERPACSHQTGELDVKLVSLEHIGTRFSTRRSLNEPEHGRRKRNVGHPQRPGPANTGPRRYREKRARIVSDIHSRAFAKRPPIVLTTIDCGGLSALLNVTSEREPSVARFLRGELDRADIIDGEVPATSLVTMGSEVKFIEHDSVSVWQVRLVYSDEANDSRDVSVLTAVGSALVGLGPGQSISWNEHGIERRLTVLEVRGGSVRENRALAARERSNT